MSLRDKYTNEEWDALEKKASNTIAERCAKLFSFGLYDGLASKNYNNLDDSFNININKSDFGKIKPKLNKKNASLDIYELLKPIGKPGTKYEENEADKKELGDLLNYSIEYAKITTNSYDSSKPINSLDDEVLKFNKLEQNLNTEFERRKGRDILDIITHKVYEKKAEGKCPEVAILSPGDYYYLGVISDFHLDYITVMGCKLKIHVSLNAEDGNIEIY